MFPVYSPSQCNRVARPICFQNNTKNHSVHPATAAEEDAPGYPLGRSLGPLLGLGVGGKLSLKFAPRGVQGSPGGPPGSTQIEHTRNSPKSKTLLICFVNLVFSKHDLVEKRCHPTTGDFSPREIPRWIPPMNPPRGSPEDPLGG